MSFSRDKKLVMSAWEIVFVIACAAIAAICLYLISSIAAKRSDASELYTGIGYVFDNADTSTGHIGYRKGGFEVEAGLYGAGDTNMGYLDKPAKYLSVARLMRSSTRVLGGRLAHKLGIDAYSSARG